MRVLYLVISRLNVNGELGETEGGGRGHKDVSTTMIYTHVLNKGGHGVRSPVDGL